MAQRADYSHGGEVTQLLPRQRQKAETRARVLQSARILFERDGVESVTVRMIAEHAGVAVGSVFTGFESKMDLLDEIIAEDLARLTEQSTKALQGHSGSVLDKLETAFAIAYRYDVQHLAKVRDSLAASWVRSPQSDQRVRTAMGPAAKLVEGVLKGGQKRGEIAANADLALIVDTIFNLYYGNLRRAVFGGWGADQLTRHLRAQMALLLGGAR